MIMLKAVLDTNVLVSTLVVPVGKPAQIVTRAYEQQFALLLSEEILQETRDALYRKHIQKRFHPTDQVIDGFLTRLRANGVLIQVQHVENIIPQDPPDNWVLACAVEGNANFLVSGNLHFLNLKRYRQIKMVTPAQFLEILQNS